MEGEILEVFDKARQAVALGDWIQVYELLDEGAVQAIGQNSLMWLAAQDPSLWGEFPSLLPLLRELREQAVRMSESAQKVLAAAGHERLALSLLHRDLVREQTALLKRAVKGQGASLGRIECLRRERGEGGSISSQLFQNERLENLVMEGNRARGMRIYPGGSQETLHFIRRRSGWKIQLTRPG